MLNSLGGGDMYSHVQVHVRSRQTELLSSPDTAGQGPEAQTFQGPLKVFETWRGKSLVPRGEKDTLNWKRIRL